MISDEVDINSLKTFTGDTALHTVCRQSAMDPFKKLQVCKLLLNLTDIDVCPANLKGMTPIHYASRSKDKNLLKLLLDRDKNNQSLYLICQDQGNPLHCLLENPSNNVESGEDDLLECIDLLGTIHILRKHLYSTKLNFITNIFHKTVPFLSKQEFIFQHYVLTKFS